MSGKTNPPDTRLYQTLMGVAEWSPQEIVAGYMQYLEQQQKSAYAAQTGAVTENPKRKLSARNEAYQTMLQNDVNRIEGAKSTIEQACPYNYDKLAQDPEDRKQSDIDAVAQEIASYEAATRAYGNNGTETTAQVINAACKKGSQRKR